jgi:cytoskeletal protein CcmA (bactofilin family)
VIAKGITVSGAMKGQGVVEIEGTVEGELELKGSVLVTSTGKVIGPITADVIRVAGRVEGSISALEHLLLESTGSIEGDVSTNTLVVENGGALNGRTTMLHAPAESPEKSSDVSTHLDDLEFGPEFQVAMDEADAS